MKYEMHIWPREPVHGQKYLKLHMYRHTYSSVLFKAEVTDFKYIYKIICLTFEEIIFDSVFDKTGITNCLKPPIVYC